MRFFHGALAARRFGVFPVTMRVSSNWMSSVSRHQQADPAAVTRPPFVLVLEDDLGPCARGAVDNGMADDE